MTTQEFIFDLPLYTKIKNSDSHIIETFYDHVRIDGYNPFRAAESTFRLRFPMDNNYTYGEEFKALCFDCQRYNDSLYVLVHFDEEKDYIEKVGQYPSIADIHIAQIKQYSKVLDKQYMKDFTKAIGLVANGIGTGSFVYLRRIFEHLVDEISKRAIENDEIDECVFNSCKMDKKLKMLENHLPDVMKDNKPLYGVLSKGIHELSEEDCLKYFSVVRQIIELILDEMEYARLKEEKKKQARNQLASIAGEIKK